MMRKISSSESSCREAKKMKEKYLKANFCMNKRKNKMLFKVEKMIKRLLHNLLIVEREYEVNIKCCVCKQF